MSGIVRFAVVSSVALALAACSGEADKTVAAPDTAPATADTPKVEITTVSVDELAERFVKLGLALGFYDKAYVDAYHGPAAWAEAAKAPPTLPKLKPEAEALLEALEVFAEDGADPRETMLARQILAAHTRIRMAEGENLPFDEETELLYDAVAPKYDLAEFDAALETIASIVPGEGDLSERVEAFHASFEIPSDKLDAVFSAAMAECRRRTLENYILPENEAFTVAYVTDKPWSGYNCYQGEYVSKIEVNTDFPTKIDRAVDLGCHEGYPGHHTWNIFVERDFLRKNGWVEYSLVPLFSPQALIGEGSANYGIQLAFPGDEKMKFEQEVLYPLAGLDPARAPELQRLLEAKALLSHARNHIVREYLDGRISREEAIELTVKYSLVAPERAEQSMRFADMYRGYVINYNLGKDIVTAYIERESASDGDRWRAFENMLTTPMSASDMMAN